MIFLRDINYSNINRNSRMSRREQKKDSVLDKTKNIILTSISEMQVLVVRGGGIYEFFKRQFSA